MRVFIAVATSSEQHVKSLKSVFTMTKRAGDNIFFPDQFGPGLSTRIVMEESFFNNREYDALLLIDADQWNPDDMLEKLREPMEQQGLDMVCAHTYRRSLSPVESLIHALGDGNYPFQPLLDIPREGLHEVAVCGFGSVLIHRRVLAAVRQSLPEGASPFAVGPLPGVTEDYGIFGQDFRFFMMARQLGYKLWLNADVESLHGVTMWHGHRTAERLMDYQAWADKQHPLWEERIKLHGMNIAAFTQRGNMVEARRRDMIAQAKALQASPNPDAQQMNEAASAISEMTGRLKEISAWIEVLQKYPAITKPEDLPSTTSMPPQDYAPEGVGEDGIAASRQQLYRDTAADIVAELPNLPSNGRS